MLRGSPASRSLRRDSCRSTLRESKGRSCFENVAGGVADPNPREKRKLLMTQTRDVVRGDETTTTMKLIRAGAADPSNKSARGTPFVPSDLCFAESSPGLIQAEESLA
jgi:hypothetical protein